jgi:hypothetical protein
MPKKTTHRGQTLYESDEIHILTANASSMELTVRRKRPGQEGLLRLEVPHTTLSPHDQNTLSLTPGKRLMRGNGYLYGAR